MPEGFNKLAMFVISNPDMELFETFGNGLKEKITSSPEWRARSPAPQPAPGSTGSGFDDMDDDSIPF